MKRFKLRSGAIACAVGLALSVAAIAHAEQVTPAPSEAEVAASPAVKRLKELLGVVNGGDGAAMAAYVQAHAVDPTKPPGPPGALPLVGSVLDLHRRSQGLKLVRVTTVNDSGAVAVVRNKLTGDEQALSIKVEPQAPHRIIALPPVPSAVAATLVRPAPIASSEQAQLQQIRSYLKTLADADIFSGVVVLARDGKPVFSQAYGYADREKKIFNAVDTPFNLGSMNKLFTGLAIGQLVEQGRLSYEDPLSKFLPGVPDAEGSKRIKIKHLLSHTSGISGSFDADASRSPEGVQAALDMIKWDPLKFEPGTKWAYSNNGFQILGRVIEVVTGEDYYDHMQKNVFGPAGVGDAMFPHFDAVSMAVPYEIELSGNRLLYANNSDTLTGRGGPPGGGVASAPNILKIANAVGAGRIVKPATLRLHATPKPELASPSYGYGFSTAARMAKRPLVGHGGNVIGGCAEFGELTDTPYTIVVLSNVTINTCISVTGKVLAVLPPRAIKTRNTSSSERPGRLGRAAVTRP